MGDFLERMAQSSRMRVARALQREGREALRARASRTLLPPPLRLRDPGFDVIAEIKRVSPSAGALTGDAGAPADEPVAKRARIYAQAGAVAISVLTEPDSFGGSLADLYEAARSVTVPVMRKDFLVDPYQIFQARASGAAGVLLILRLLDPARLIEMLEAASAMRLFVLLEAFDQADLDRTVEARRFAQTMDVTVLVGVNCRNLASLEVDRGRFATLRPESSARVPVVAESGLQTPEHAREVASLGYRLGLVGSALMRSEDPRGSIKEMLAAGREEVKRCAYR